MDDKQAKMAKCVYEISMSHIDGAFVHRCEKCDAGKDVSIRAVDNISGPLAEFAFAAENVEILKKSAIPAAIASEHTFNALAMQYFETVDDIDPKKAAMEFKRIADFYRTRVDHFDAKAQEFLAKVSIEDLIGSLSSEGSLIMLPVNHDGTPGKVDLSSVPERDRPAIQAIINEVAKMVSGAAKKQPPDKK